MPVLNPLPAWLDRLVPPGPLAPRDAFLLRVVAGGAALGAVVAALAFTSTLLLAGLLPALPPAGFGAGCVGLLLAARAGRRVSELRRLAVWLVGVFLFAACLESPTLDWAQLRWLALLPMLSALSGERSADGQGTTEPSDTTSTGGRPWRSAALALLLCLMVLAAKRMGWTAALPEDAVTVAGVDLGALVDLALFILSVGGLMAVHASAQARLEEELWTLRRMLAVCAWCRKVRDDELGWVAVERFMARHAPEQLTHGICPECASKLDSEG